MNIWKKGLVAILAMLMVLTGIYIAPTDGKEAKAETTDISTDMLNVKVQIATNDSGYMRFVSSVDSLDYSVAGFEVTPEGGTTKTHEIYTVYEKIRATTAGTAYEFSPKVVSTISEYFMTAKFAAEKNVNYAVRAFVIPLGGTDEDKVYGDARVVGLKDGAANVLNLAVNGVLEETGNSATVTTYASATGTDVVTGADVEVLSTGTDYSNVRVSLGDTVTVDDLTSASKVTIGTATGVYRNYNTTHVKVVGDATQINADVSWYYVNPSSTEFVIASSADLYGLASIVNANTDTFASNKVILVKNVEINKGTAKKSAETGGTPAWTADEGEVTYSWTPIGTSATICFNGTFDGDGNEIGGIYLIGTAAGSGFFGFVGNTCTVCDFKFVNSYLSSEYGTLGMIGSSSMLKMEDVYADFVLTYKGGYSGGMIGQLYGQGQTTTPAQTINNCWFDGEIYHRGGSFYSAFIGNVATSANLKITNCLVTGDICNATGNWCSALIGYMGVACNIDIQNVLALGEVPSGFRHGSIVSRIEYATGSLKNVYTTVPTDETPLYGYGTAKVTQTNVSAESRDDLLITKESELNMLLPKLEGETESAWVCDTACNSTDRGTPILRKFASWWKERYVIEADTSWYDAEDADKTFTITTAEQMYGFAELSKTNTFAGYTIKLGADIELNTSNPSRVDAWKGGTEVPLNQWSPIGPISKPFAGTFDGQGYIITGMYTKGGDYSGLFGYVDKTGIVRDFCLTDSYIETTGNYVGTIAYLHGECDSIYSDVVINAKSGSGYVGGIIGRFRGQCDTYSQALYDETAPQQTIGNCWFDGKIMLAAGVNYAGGITSELFANAVVNFENCLVTGDIEGTTVTYVGGLYAYDNSSMQIHIKNCLTAGTVNVPNATNSGALMAGIKSYTKVNITNAYTAGTPAFSFNNSSFTQSLVASDYEKAKADISANLFPALAGETESAWADNTAYGIPVLKYFIK